MNESSAADFGTVPQAAETFGSVPQGSEPFGNLPQSSETFRIVPKAAERTDQHTLTVREVARLFEQAGVPRTERSIVNWCQLNHQGIARLDAFFDTNERKYFITPQSVTAAIREEQAKQAGGRVASDSADEIPKAAERTAPVAEESDAIEALRVKVRDLEITNRVKDQFIDILEKDREKLANERENYVRELMGQSHRIGQLETQILQLGAPAEAGGKMPKITEAVGSIPQREHVDSRFENGSLAA